MTRRPPMEPSLRRLHRRVVVALGALSLLVPMPARSDFDATAAGVMTFSSTSSTASAAGGRLLIPADTAIRRQRLRIDANMASSGRWAILVLREVGDPGVTWWKRGASFKYTTIFGGDFCMPYDGCGRYEQDTHMTWGPENEGNFSERFLLAAGLYDVMLFTEDGHRATATLAFEGLTGEASFDLVDPVVGARAESMHTSITETRTDHPDVMLHGRLDAWLEGPIGGYGFATSVMWMKFDTVIEARDSTCLGDPESAHVFDEDGRCTGNEGSRGYIGGPVLGSVGSISWDQCAPGIHTYCADRVRMAATAEFDGLRASIGGVGMFITWP